ncbi:MAG TPA: hypothetical protein VLA19_18630, partial [Herpetosiphonaceae bacterium]|nr:hypothetical protein [Herpetosiphonaceae bacterium]
MPSQAELLTWYLATFVPDPERGYALMNSASAQHKYTRKGEALKTELIGGGLSGATRRPRATGWTAIPLSVACVPAHRDGWALAAAIDIDAGGAAAVQRALAVCADYGLWAFAQLGTSAEHDGGHVYIPVDKPAAASLLQDLAARVQACAGVPGEAYPNGDHDLRLPLMLHLRAPGGPKRFPLLLQSGELVDVTDPWAALATLHTRWRPNTLEELTAAVGRLPALSITNPQKLHKSKVNPQNGASVIRWFNDNHDLTDLLSSIGVRGADRLGAVRCPWHGDRNPSLVIWRHHGTGHLVCRCYSQRSGCPAAEPRYWDAFNVYCEIEGLSPSDAVKRLADEHGLGRRRELRTTDTGTAAPPEV